MGSNKQQKTQAWWIFFSSLPGGGILEAQGVRGVGTKLMGKETQKKHIGDKIRYFFGFIKQKRGQRILTCLISHGSICI